ncbi:transcriptional regulator [Pseudomonas sp. GL-B-19]|uniref:winged helix-turn-helix domain-containing protein n=1 Tax=Pseudomonas sp. GL-B-19 TaxID=2832393 RepID=UPI001CBA8EFF|nr:winged helix-turn-helix domain-containing protein [Pseudomonas sp. GL-B-19]
MTSTDIQEPRLSKESPQSVDTVNTRTIPPPPGCHVIRCAKPEHYVHFEPTCQLLTFFFGEQLTSKVELSFSSSRLLELLITRANTIVAREDILAYAWPGRVVTQSSLNQAISSIREHLSDEVAKEIIQTMPRRGYQLNSRFLIPPEERPAFQHDINLAPTIAASPSGERTALMQCIVKSRRIFLLLLIAFLFATLVWRSNLTLLVQPGLAVSTEHIGNKSLLYTAPDNEKLATLYTEISPLRDRLLAISGAPITLLFNRMYNYFDVICINQYGSVSTILMHHSQITKINDHQLLACVK